MKAYTKQRRRRGETEKGRREIHEKYISVYIITIKKEETCHVLVVAHRPFLIDWITPPPLSLSLSLPTLIYFSSYLSRRLDRARPQTIWIRTVMAYAYSRGDAQIKHPNKTVSWGKYEITSAPDKEKRSAKKRTTQVGKAVGNSSGCILSLRVCVCV